MKDPLKEGSLNVELPKGKTLLHRQSFCNNTPLQQQLPIRDLWLFPRVTVRHRKEMDQLL